ncbi:Tyrosine-protein kinase receptor TYRO3 [Liparis tanakae]|uniref:Tyrosine-protein kinase receptor TYRO3 n=1 Tax=Liparis tanakae TaxID=230148 RepID=A0A4Z2JB12_9TELE|nr:Tyrosine-protein kinase receptor TYRO3 [Liparis tanakae]
MYLLVAPVDSLGINEDLKNKLQDVLIPERLLTLGHMLGKGEFGSVREAFLKTEDSSVLKVAVKVLRAKEALLYVNLEEGQEEEAAGGSVSWQRRAEDQEKDWLMVGSEVALAIGGDYRYIIGPPEAPEEEGEATEAEDDLVINV